VTLSDPLFPLAMGMLCIAEELAYLLARMQKIRAIVIPRISLLGQTVGPDLAVKNIH